MFAWGKQNCTGRKPVLKDPEKTIWHLVIYSTIPQAKMSNIKKLIQHTLIQPQQKQNIESFRGVQWRALVASANCYSYHTHTQRSTSLQSEDSYVFFSLWQLHRILQVFCPFRNTKDTYIIHTIFHYITPFKSCQWMPWFMSIRSLRTSVHSE